MKKMILLIHAVLFSAFLPGAELPKAPFEMTEDGYAALQSVQDVPRANVMAFCASPLGWTTFMKRLV